MTWLIILSVLCLGVIAYRRNVRAPSAAARRKTHAWAWAFWGGIIGSFFGIAGLGGAIAGTGVGALIGYLAATAMMKVDRNDSAQTAAVSYEEQEEYVPHTTAESGSYSLPTQWHLKVNRLRELLEAGAIQEIHALPVSDQTGSPIDPNDVSLLEHSQTWWLERNTTKWHLHLFNSCKAPIDALCLSITPGPSDEPAGPSNSVILALFEPILPGASAAVVFDTPPGSSADHHIQNVVITGAWA